ncbi:hypothetical protein CC2G_015194 [Coprinopsis cinerea AmutBmut pab1-1]|nr:hypothetical protein CC2G_015194 [Coprinopsis cinerea AmutBmut pab1-1]
MTDTTTAKIKVTVYAYVMPPVELEIDHANAKADAIMTQISNDLLDRLDSEPIGGHGPMNDESLIYPACEWMMCLCGEQRVRAPIFPLSYLITFISLIVSSFILISTFILDTDSFSHGTLPQCILYPTSYCSSFSHCLVTLFYCFLLVLRAAL